MNTELPISLICYISWSTCLMGVSRHHHSAFDLISKRLFPNIGRSRRKTHMRFLLLSIGLGLLICGLLGSVLWLMNRTSF